MTVVNTRIRFVDVARRLFAKNGVENTTMNDIAQGAGKGRRTLYTYFKSKEEIFQAVIEGELERINEKMWHDSRWSRRTSLWRSSTRIST